MFWPVCANWGCAAGNMGLDRPGVVIGAPGAGGHGSDVLGRGGRVGDPFLLQDEGGVGDEEGVGLAVGARDF
jgi:hypothetical protein